MDCPKCAENMDVLAMSANNETIGTTTTYRCPACGCIRTRTITPDKMREIYGSWFLISASRAIDDYATETVSMLDN